MANLVAHQLSRFVTLNRHQLAGQVANLDFWMAQVRHCQQVIDGYGERFSRLKDAQAKHTKEHHTDEFMLDDPYDEAEQSPYPTPPRRVSHVEMRDARRSVCDAAYHFLVRCFNEGFITEKALRSTCDELGISVAVSDLRRITNRST